MGAFASFYHLMKLFSQGKLFQKQIDIAISVGFLKPPTISPSFPVVIQREHQRHLFTSINHTNALLHWIYQHLFESLANYSLMNNIEYNGIPLLYL